MYTSTFLLALGFASQGVMATGYGGGGWGSGKAFNCPGNTPTTCSNDQSSGFNWSQAQVGQQVTSYGGCSFQNTKCESSGPGRKIRKRTGLSDKCVQGPIHKDVGSCPKMSAGKNDKGAGDNFSPKTYHVSCSYDTHVDFVYTMKDGSTCKHTSPCSAGGNDVQNTQCGGAVTVHCQQNEQEKTKNKGKECNMGIHSIGFQCGTPPSITPPKSTSPVSSKPATSSKPQTSSQPHTESKSTESKPQTSTVHTESKPNSSSPPSTESKPTSSAPSTQPKSSTESKPATSPPTTQNTVKTTPVPSSTPGQPPYQNTMNSTAKISTTPVASSKSVPLTTAQSTFQTTTFMTTSVVFHTTLITKTECAASITNCPANSKTPTVVTSTISSFTTVCPVTATMVPSGSSMVPVVVESSKPAETTPVATSKPAESSAKPSSSAPAPGVPSNIPNTGCPNVVPDCIETLLQSVQTKCQNNADIDCLCPDAEHTKFIQQCISSHGANAGEVQTALSFFQGICAAHIPKNPSIVTHQPDQQPQQPQCPSGVPATTVTVQFTTTASATTPVATTKAPEGTAPAAPAAPQVITTSSVVTIPQVQITQPPAAASGSSQAPAALVPGNGDSTAPAATVGPTLAVPTPAAPAVTSAAPMVPAYGGTAAVASTGGVRGTGVVNPPIATGAAGKVGVSFGAAVAAAALLL